MELKIHSSWEKQLAAHLKTESFQQLMHFVRSEYEQLPNAIFPNENHIFRAFEACPFEEVKVVILGQDPYPTLGHAHGLCFSCDENVKPLPKSLQNIFKELEADLQVPALLNGDLNFWAEQGVLLLNSILTVRERRPMSHANKGWENFSDEVIRLIDANCEKVVFVLWGSPAQKKAAFVNEQKHLILRAPHPSPLSSYRGFFGSKPFSKINEHLVSLGTKPIKWTKI